MGTAPQTAPSLPKEISPTRVRNFANFFKGYMGLWSVVTAALPIPVTSLGFIPTYKAYTPILSTYTSLFCFLLLGYVFYSRHSLARLYFGKGPSFAPKRAMALLPVILILLSLLFVFLYHLVLRISLSLPFMSPGTGDALKSVPYPLVPYGPTLMALYLGIFLSAELAFIVMATREYLQDAIGIPESDLFGDVGSRPTPDVLVFFSSTPTYATVQVDGEQVGHTPCTKKIPIGRHEIRMTYYGCKDWLRPLQLTPDETVSILEATLEGL